MPDAFPAHGSPCAIPLQEIDPRAWQATRPALGLLPVQGAKFGFMPCEPPASADESYSPHHLFLTK